MYNPKAATLNNKLRNPPSAVSFKPKDKIDKKLAINGKSNFIFYTYQVGILIFES